MSSLGLDQAREIMRALRLPPEDLMALAADVGSPGARQQTIREFWEQGETEAKLSPAQRRTYLKPLRQFIEERGGLLPLQLTPLVIEDFAATVCDHAKARGWTGTYSHEHALQAIRWLCGRMVKARLILANPAKEVEFRPRPDCRRRPLTVGEFSVLWDVASHTGNDPQLDRLIVWLQRETAACQRAMTRLTLGALDDDVCAIRLDEKNNRQPLVPASARLIAALREHAFSTSRPKQYGRFGTNVEVLNTQEDGSATLNAYPRSSTEGRSAAPKFDAFDIGSTTDSTVVPLCSK